jgi:hypothetical protein
VQLFVGSPPCNLGDLYCELLIDPQQAKIEKGVDIRSQQQAIADFVGVVAAIRADVCRL